MRRVSDQLDDVGEEVMGARRLIGRVMMVQDLPFVRPTQ